MTNQLELKKPMSLLPSPAEWTMLKESASMAVKSGFLPRAVDNAEKAITIALKGRELGIPPMQAFSHIHIIQGKPTISAELMLSLIYKNCPGAVINYLENTPEKCVIEAKRPNHKPTLFSYTIAEAKIAGLLSKDSWKGYPAAMLRARTVSILARALFPDAIMGCSYTPEELGASVNDEGQVIDIPTGPKSEPKPEQKPAAAVLDAEVVNHSDPADYVMPFGKWKGQRVGDLDVYELDSYCRYIVRSAKEKGQTIGSGQVSDTLNAVEAFLIDREFEPKKKEGA